MNGYSAICEFNFTFITLILNALAATECSIYDTFTTSVGTLSHGYFCFKTINIIVYAFSVRAEIMQLRLHFFQYINDVMALVVNKCYFKSFLLITGNIYGRQSTVNYAFVLCHLATLVV